MSQFSYIGPDGKLVGPGSPSAGSTTSASSNAIASPFDTQAELDSLNKLIGVQPQVTQEGQNLTLATALSPGAVPHWPPLLVDVGLDALAQGTIPAFAANVSSIFPGTDKACSYTLASTVALAAGSTLYVNVTDLTTRPCDVFITCKALALGYALSVVNNGPAAGTLGTFAGSLTKAEVMKLWWNGKDYIFNGQVWLAP